MTHEITKYFTTSHNRTDRPQTMPLKPIKFMHQRIKSVTKYFSYSDRSTLFKSKPPPAVTQRVKRLIGNVKPEPSTRLQDSFLQLSPWFSRIDGSTMGQLSVYVVHTHTNSKGKTAEVGYDLRPILPVVVHSWSHDCDRVQRFFRKMRRGRGFVMGHTPFESIGIVVVVKGWEMGVFRKLWLITTRVGKPFSNGGWGGLWSWFVQL